MLAYIAVAYIQGSLGSAGLLRSFRSWLWQPVSQDAYKCVSAQPYSETQSMLLTLETLVAFPDDGDSGPQCQIRTLRPQLSGGRCYQSHAQPFERSRKNFSLCNMSVHCHYILHKRLNIQQQPLLVSSAILPLVLRLTRWMCWLQADFHAAVQPPTGFGPALSPDAANWRSQQNL